MWRYLLFLLVASTVWAAGKPKYFKPPVSTADHTEFKELRRELKKPQEVTKACLSCHNKAGEHVKKTLHFTWTWKASDGRTLGKAHVINNF